MTKLSAKSVASRSRSRKRWVAAALGAASLLGWSSNASAQGWLADRRYAEGAGIRAGDLELHPGIGGEVGYDSNWFQRSSESGPNIVNGAPNTPVRDALVFRITPQFYISTLTRQRVGNLQDGAQDGSQASQAAPRRFVTFRGGASATARFFIGKEMEDQHNVGINADARFDFNQGQQIGAAVHGSYNRIVQPQVQGNPDLAFNHDDIRGGADLIFLPGGGTLDVRAGYQLTASFYEQSNGVPYSSLTHEINLRDRWKFRPRTALFSEATLGFINYPHANDAVFNLDDATPLRTRAGITGLLTNWFGLLAAAGYGATFFKQSREQQFDSFTGQVDGTFYLGGNPTNDLPGDATALLSNVTVGVARDFQRSLLGNFYTSNRVYAKVMYWFGGRFVFDIHATGEQLNYPTVFYNAGAIAPTPEFTNYRLVGGLFGEYRFTSALGLNATVDYTQVFSDTQLPAGSTTGPGAAPSNQVFDLNYKRLQAFLGLRYFY